MPELKLNKRYKYAGDIMPKLLDIGFDLETATDFLNGIEDADVVEVRYGEWKLIETKGFCDGSFYSRFCCPLCLREIGVCHDYEKDAYYNAKAIYPYCHCGAKMDGD